MDPRFSRLAPTSLVMSPRSETAGIDIPRGIHKWDAQMEKLIAVIGATGQQGGGVVTCPRAGGQFKVRALTRNPDKHRELAEEVIEADLNRPETLAAAFKGAHGVFLVTTSSLEGTDERKQGTAAVKAASDAGVKHVVWSTLPDVEAISGSKSDVPALYEQGQGRSDSQGRGVCESYVER